MKQQDTKQTSQYFKSHQHAPAIFRQVVDTNRFDKLAEIRKDLEDGLTNQQFNDWIYLTDKYRIYRDIYKFPKKQKQHFARLLFSYLYHPQCEIFFSNHFFLIHDLYKLISKKRNMNLTLDWRPVFRWHYNLFYMKNSRIYHTTKIHVLKVVDMHINLCFAMKKYPREGTTQEVYGTFREQLTPLSKNMWEAMSHLALFLPTKRCTKADYSIWFDELMKLWVVCPGRHNMNTLFIYLFVGLAKTHAEINWDDHLEHIYDVCFAGLVFSNKPKDEKGSSGKQVEEIVLSHCGAQQEMFGRFFAYTLDDNVEHQSWEYLRKIIAATKIYIEQDAFQVRTYHPFIKAIAKLFFGICAGLSYRIRKSKEDPNKMKPISKESAQKVFLLIYDQIKKIPLSMNGDLLSVLKRCCFYSPTKTMYDNIFPLLKIQFQNLNNSHQNVVNLVRNFLNPLFYQKFPHRFEILDHILNHLVQQSQIKNQRLIFLITFIFQRALTFIPFVHEQFWKQHFEQSEQLTKEYECYDDYLQHLQQHNIDKYNFFILQEKIGEFTISLFSNFLNFLKTIDNEKEEEESLNKYSLLKRETSSKEGTNMNIQMICFIRLVIINSSDQLALDLFKVFKQFVLNQQCSNAKIFFVPMARSFAAKLGEKKVHPFLEELIDKIFSPKPTEEDKFGKMKEIISQKIEWYLVVIQGFLAGIRVFSQHFTNSLLKPLILTLFNSQSTENINHGNQLLRACFKQNEFSLFLPNYKNHHPLYMKIVAKSVKNYQSLSTALFHQIYQKVGDFTPDDFELQYTQPDTQSIINIIHIAEQALDLSLTKLSNQKSEEKMSQKLIRIFRVVQAYWINGNLLSPSIFNQNRQKVKIEFWHKIFKQIAGGDDKASQDLIKKIEGIDTKFQNALLLALQKVNQLHQIDSAMLNTKLLLRMNQAIKSFFNSYQQDYWTQSKYGGSTKFSLNLHYPQKKARRIYNSFFIKVYSYNQSTYFWYLRQTDNLRQIHYKVIDSLMKFTDHPQNVDFSPTILKIRRYFNTKDIFEKMLQSILGKLENIMKKFQQFDNINDINDFQIKRLKRILESMTEILHRYPTVFEKQGFIMRYISTLIKVTSMQSRKIQIPLMTSFFAFLGGFEFGLPQTEVLQVNKVNAVLEQLLTNNDLKIHATKITSVQESKYKSYLSFVQLFKQGAVLDQNQMHWSAQALYISLNYIFMKFMTDQELEKLEDNLVQKFENSQLSSMHTLLCKAIEKVLQFRNLKFGDKIQFSKNRREYGSDQDKFTGARYRYLPDDYETSQEYFDRVSDGWLCTPSMYSMKPKKSSYQNYIASGKVKSNRKILELFSNYQRFKRLVLQLTDNLKNQQDSSQVGGEQTMMNRFRTIMSGTKNMNISLACGLLNSISQNRADSLETFRPNVFFGMLYSATKFYSKQLIELLLKNVQQFLKENNQAKDKVDELSYKILNAVITACLRGLKWCPGQTESYQERLGRVFLQIYENTNYKIMNTLSLQVYRATIAQDPKRYKKFYEIVLKNPFDEEQIHSQSFMERYLVLNKDTLVNMKNRSFFLCEKLIPLYPKFLICKYPMLNTQMKTFIADSRIVLQLNVRSMTPKQEELLKDHPLKLQYEKYFDYQLNEFNPNNWSEADANIYATNILHIITQLYPTKMRANILLPQVEKFIKFAFEFLSHTDEKISRQACNSIYSLILTRFPIDIVEKCLKLFEQYDNKNQFWKKREQALQCKVVMQACNVFRRGFHMKYIVQSCLNEQNHKTKIVKSSALSIALEYAKIEQVESIINELIASLIEEKKRRKDKKDNEKIFDYVNLLIGFAQSEITQIKGYTPKLLSTLSKYQEGYDEASDSIKKLFARFWLKNQRKWPIIKSHFSEDEQESIKGMSNPFNYYT